MRSEIAVSLICFFTLCNCLFPMEHGNHPMAGGADFIKLCSLVADKVSSETPQIDAQEQVMMQASTRKSEPLVLSKAISKESSNSAISATSTVQSAAITAATATETQQPSMSTQQKIAENFLKKDSVNNDFEDPEVVLVHCKRLFKFLTADEAQIILSWDRVLSAIFQHIPSLHSMLSRIVSSASVDEILNGDIRKKIAEILSIEKINIDTHTQLLQNIYQRFAHSGKASNTHELESYKGISKALSHITGSFEEYEKLLNILKSDDIEKNYKPLLIIARNFKQSYAPISNISTAFELNSLRLRIYKQTFSPSSHEELTLENYCEKLTDFELPNRPLINEGQASTLHEAALANDRKRILELIAGHHNINEINAQGLAPLHIAVMHGKRNAIITLLENGANPNVYSTTVQQLGLGARLFGPLVFLPSPLAGKTPLHLAATYANKNTEQQQDIVCTLLRYGADINAQVGYNFWFYNFSNYNSIWSSFTPSSYCRNVFCHGCTALHLAISQNNVELSKLLIKRGASLSIIGASPSGIGGYMTPLCLAAHQGNLGIVDMLIQNPCQYQNLSRALFNAATNGHVDIVRLLLQQNTISAHDCHSPLDMICVFWEFKLSQIANFLEIVRLLLEKGGRPDYRGNLLRYVVTNDRAIAFARLLMEYKVDIDDALMHALSHGDGNDECIRLLLSHGAHVKTVPLAAQNRYWIKYPLHEAADAGDVDRVLKILKTTGNKINQTDEHGIMPLHYAAFRGNTQVINALCEALAIVNIGDDSGLLPLHCAAYKGNNDIVRALLRRDKIFLQSGTEVKTIHSTVNAQNVLGLTPLHAAIIKGHVDTAHILIKKGAKLEQLSAKGLKTIEYAWFNKKSLNYFLPVTTIGAITQEHSVPSTCEDQNEAVYVLDADFQGCAIQGKIVPSLQQMRSSNDATTYCGYYALYNTLSLLNFDTARCPEKVREFLNFGTFERTNRHKFSLFFNFLLQLISDKRKYGKLGNLIGLELRYLMSVICPGQPIAVIEKNNIKAVLDNIDSPQVAFELQDSDKDLDNLQRFFNRELDNIVLICGVGIFAGHWIVLYAQREADGSVSCTVCDSLRRVCEWRNNIDLVYNNIVPFYHALTNSIEQWPTIFDTQLRSETFEEYQPKKDRCVTIQSMSQSNKLSFLIDALQRHIEITDRLKDVLDCFITVIDQNMINWRLRLLFNMRLERFKKTSEVLFLSLLSSRLKLQPHDPYQAILTELESLFFQSAHDASDPDIYNCLKSIAKLSSIDWQQRSIIAQQLHKIITKLNKMSQLTSQIENSLSSFPDNPLFPLCAMPFKTL